MRIISNQSEKRFMTRLMKNGKKIDPTWSELIRGINTNEYEPILNQVFNPDQSESIRARINPNRIFNQNQCEWIRGRNDSD